MSKTKTETKFELEMIPRNREMSTAKRLRLVADILQENPERHTQYQWSALDWNNDVNAYWSDETVILSVAAHKTCGSKGCVAGWAIAATPPAVVNKVLDRDIDHYDTWVAVGSGVLGLDVDLAEMLFDEANKRPRLIKALRRLADLPPKTRTLEAAAEIGITYAWLRGEGRARLRGER